MLLFHNTSEYIYKWLQQQPFVKEESLTDWLLYNISQKTDKVYYKTFTRHEEAFNGTDWEWWIIANEYSTMRAYRFLVQAKKLKSKDDNYPLLSYGNRNGLQVDLLIKAAIERRAMPLYAYYSGCKPNINNQVNNIDYINRNLLEWCKNCINGCFLTSAFEIPKCLFNIPRRVIYENELIDSSFGLSLLDSIFIKQNNSEYRIYDILNNHFNSNLKPHSVSNNGYGFLYDKNEIPVYVKKLIEYNKENLDWYEKEFDSSFTNLSGIAVIDTRE